MASTTFVLEDAIKAIAANGFYHIEDPAVGQRIAEMEKNKHQFSTTSTAGLEFYRDNVHEDQVSQLSKNSPSRLHSDIGSAFVLSSKTPLIGVLLEITGESRRTEGTSSSSGGVVQRPTFSLFSYGRMNAEGSIGAVLTEYHVRR